jgi:hypothetical protein
MPRARGWLLVSMALASRSVRLAWAAWVPAVQATNGCRSPTSGGAQAGRVPYAAAVRRVSAIFSIRGRMKQDSGPPGMPEKTAGNRRNRVCLADNFCLLRANRRGYMPGARSPVRFRPARVGVARDILRPISGLFVSVCPGVAGVVRGCWPPPVARAWRPAVYSWGRISGGS